MFHAPAHESPTISWLYLAIWTLSIYLTIPLARLLQAIVVDNMDRTVFAWITVFWVVICGAAALLLVLRHHRMATLGQYFWMAVVIAAYLGGTWQLRANPEEALHFVQYGVLGLLAYRVLTHHVRDVTIFFSAAVICGLLGTLDEIIQWVTPRRFFDFRDVLINFVGGALMQLGIALGIRPGLIRLQWPTDASLRLCARLTAGFLILLALCASSTPQLWQRLAVHVPPLEYLASNHSMMADYGHRHTDPDIGVFVSRFSKPELASEDRAGAERRGPLLHEYHDPARYQEFLELFPAFSHPFLHEARVRQFRRDRHLAKARKHEPGSRRQVHHVTVATREDMILRRYFSQTYQAANLHPGQKDQQAMHQWHDPDARYVSPVGGQLFTRVRLWQIWVLVLAAVVVLEGGQRVYARRRKHWEATVFF
jgi:hypothetical protein